MTARIDLGAITVHRINEQEGPFFDALQFFPTLGAERLAENRSWLRPRFLDADDRVVPIVAERRADILGSAHAFEDGAWLVPTPGDSTGHFSVCVGAPGVDAVITGDMIHSPLQACYPALGLMSDYDSAQAARPRIELFSRFCDTATLICTAHFPSPSTGRVVRWRDAFDIG